MIKIASFLGSSLHSGEEANISFGRTGNKTKKLLEDMLLLVGGFLCTCVGL